MDADEHTSHEAPVHPAEQMHTLKGMLDRIHPWCGAIVKRLLQLSKEHSYWNNKKMQSRQFLIYASKGSQE